MLEHKTDKTFSGGKTAEMVAYANETEENCKMCVESRISAFPFVPEIELCRKDYL